ncbi:hypothetical protein QUF80_19770 [Desulfococcaceae bacterium HSG8]|nr:hypothetical protein [Desulfococcaceae bacterium HSG8]
MMRYIKKLAGFICFTSSIIVLASCGKMIQYPMRSQAGVQALVNSLMTQVKDDSDMPENKDRKPVIVIDPFYDADSGEVLEVSEIIERIIIEKSGQRFQEFTFEKMTSESIDIADYLINGVIHPEIFEGSGDQTYERRYYHIFAGVINLKTGSVVANSDIWLSDLDLTYKPTPAHRDSPMYIKEKDLENADKDAFKVKAMLTDGDAAYGKGIYKKAVEFYDSVKKYIETRQAEPEEKMKTYARLYMVRKKLGFQDQAEEAFAKLIAISVEEKKMLAFKFLFNVSSVEFWDDPGLKKEYDIWLRQIGRYFSNTSHCLQITGHSSRSGTPKINEALSLSRAKKIQDKLHPYFPQVYERTKAVGMGFRENIIGTGTDDDTDRLDRRVELVVTDCD